MTPLAVPAEYTPGATAVLDRLDSYFGPSRDIDLEPGVREALADERPCQVVLYHAPRPSRTQGHHIFPVYLQNGVYGRVRYGDLLWCCGTCHDSIHDWIAFLLKDAREPRPHPGRHAKVIAAAVVAWYLAERPGA